MKKILVAIDFSDVTSLVISKVEEYAKFADSEVLLLYVEEPEPDWIGFEPGPQVLRDKKAESFHRHKQELERYEKELQEKGLKVKALMVQGGIVDKILEEAKKIDADLIMMGTHGYGAFHKVLLGSVSKDMLKVSKYPILFIPSKSAKK